VYVRKNPPVDISICAGEALYQLRSALDHIAFEPVKANKTGQPLPPNWEETCEFPLRCKLSKGATLPRPQGEFERVLPCISPVAFAFIQALQPYYGSGLSEIMGWLAHLSNIDKHRYLNLTVTNLAYRETVILPSGWVSQHRTGIQHGTEIPSPIPKSNRSVNVKRTSSAYVTFKEISVGRARYMSVQELLHLFSKTIKKEIIPAFVHFLK
jgi:hypothetical protein